MKILIAPDSFKGSLSAMEVCDNIEIGIRKVNKGIKIRKVPMALEESMERTPELLQKITENINVVNV